MSGITRAMLERIMRPLWECPDCRGKGQREHAAWPKPEMIVRTDSAEATSNVESPRKEFKRCETCRGTGSIK